MLLKLTRTVLRAGLAAAALAQPAAAAPLSLAKSFEGNISVAGTQASLQRKAGGAKVCDLAPGASASLALPSGAGVVSATLYWAGTGKLDPDVLLDGARVDAGPARRYASSIDGFSYFAAAADVTRLVKDKTGTSYTFGGLEVDVSDAYCAKKQKENGMVAGFALVVVYAGQSQPYRSVNLYEGLHAIKNGSVTVSMPDYAPAGPNSGTGRFGYIVWEGDGTGNQNGDHVSFNGETLSVERYIPTDNAFNSKSSANGDENSMGIDFDFVNLPTPPATSAGARAVFTTRSDRVLLGTAILALPAKRADLAIRKTAAGEFMTGGEVSYTLEVSNLGGRADSQVVVKDELPATLTHVSAGGPDWSCTVAGQLVRCSYGKPLPPGGKASVQITARINGEGRISNTAEVSGTGDADPSNDRSTDTQDALPRPTGGKSFVFTAALCQPGDTIKPAGSGGCARFRGPVAAGSKPMIYLTHAQNGVAVAVDASKDASPSLRFALVCNNPATSAGTVASYAKQALGACVAEKAAGAAAGTQAAPSFKAGEASIALEFHYPDVGIVSLRAQDDDGGAAATTFASVPAEIGVEFKRADGVGNPASASLAEPAFAEAGEPFLAVVSARGHGGVGPLANFGNESGEYAPANRLAIRAEGGAAEEALLEAKGEWQWSKDRPVERGLAWNEAGMARLKASLKDYLGAVSLESEVQTVGRFYPQYFQTETSGGFGCLPRMRCPTGQGQAIELAIHSGQAFTATVRAYGRNGEELERFVAPHVPAISLTAVGAAGADKELDTQFAGGAPAAATDRDLTYRLDKIYDAEKGGREWTPPTAVYVRADAPELRKTPAGSEAVTISSLRADPKIPSLEGGIMVLNGRLLVGNVIGTPLSKTPVPLHAQYWSGAAWERNPLVQENVPVSATVVFKDCRRSLRVGVSGDTCNLDALMVQGTDSGLDSFLLPVLEQGKASLVLAPVGERSGTVDLFIQAVGREWLPSTVGRVSFGQFKSPVIYIREGY